jgi:hypothetical protein
LQLQVAIGDNMTRKVPSEFSEQVSFVNHTRKCGLYLFAVPNGGERSIDAAQKASQEGVLAGVTDLIIADSPPNLPDSKGVILEMKRIDGTVNDVSAEQRDFMWSMAQRGWTPVVAFGCRDGLQKLRKLGYRV